MRLLAGTSGFSYKEWCGAFYPEKQPAKGMLGFYAQQLPAVEINNTFYRMPSAAAIQGWREQVPEAFKFAIKVPRRISHSKRLKDCGEDLTFLGKTAAGLAPCLGCFLVQLPPYAKCDAASLATFLAELPQGHRAAFEFRHESWLVPQVFDVLRAHNAALVQSESDDTFEVLPWTADWAYLRLRKVSYSQSDLAAWLERLDFGCAGDAFVFFKHEDGATGPKLAKQFLALATRAEVR